MKVKVGRAEVQICTGDANINCLSADNTVMITENGQDLQKMVNEFARGKN